MITAVFILSPSTSMSLAASQTSFEIGNGVDKADALIVGIEMPPGEQLAGRGAVCEPNSGRSPAFCACNRPPVSARKIPFPGPMTSRGQSRGPGAFLMMTWRISGARNGAGWIGRVRLPKRLTDLPMLWSEQWRAIGLQAPV